MASWRPIICWHSTAAIWQEGTWKLSETSTIPLSSPLAFTKPLHHCQAHRLNLGTSVFWSDPRREVTLHAGRPVVRFVDVRIGGLLCAESGDPSQCQRSQFPCYVHEGELASSVPMLVAARNPQGKSHDSSSPRVRGAVLSPSAPLGRSVAVGPRRKNSCAALQRTGPFDSGNRMSFCLSDRPIHLRNIFLVPVTSTGEHPSPTRDWSASWRRNSSLNQPAQSGTTGRPKRCAMR